jgi:hypothetical protein
VKFLDSNVGQRSYIVENLINNPGETNSRRRHLPKMPNTGTLRNLC